MRVTVQLYGQHEGDYLIVANRVLPQTLRAFYKQRQDIEGRPYWCPIVPTQQQLLEALAGAARLAFTIEGRYVGGGA